jgi:ribosome maturation factor RimP
MHSNIPAAVEQLVEPMLEEMGIELVEVQFRREAAGLVLRLIIDKENGVGIDDCTRVSRQTGHLLEVEELIKPSFHLEVSSPGLDRPLITERDFNRNRDREVKVTFKEPAGQSVSGIILGAADGSVLIQAEEEEVSIPLDGIAKAKLIL